MGAAKISGAARGLVRIPIQGLRKDEQMVWHLGAVVEVPAQVLADDRSEEPIRRQAGGAERLGVVFSNDLHDI